MAGPLLCICISKLNKNCWSLKYWCLLLSVTVVNFKIEHMDRDNYSSLILSDYMISDNGDKNSWAILVFWKTQNSYWYLKWDISFLIFSKLVGWTYQANILRLHIEVRAMVFILGRACSVLQGSLFTYPSYRLTQEVLAHYLSRAPMLHPC